ncbi:MAG: hypothetical protein J6J60_04860 [Clostridia bacterium]|nr:hypothetical protein [Clostridia bacterium]
MSDSLITIVAIFLAAILMFVFPLMSVAERSDDISQLSAQTATTEFVDTTRTTGKITWTNYNNLITTLAATGNAYTVDMEVKIKDENVGKKSAWTSGTVIGENVYYSVYTTQILDEMEKGGESGVYKLKEGDIFSASVKNTNTTLAQSIRSIFYSISGSGTSQVAAQHSGVVTSNAK